MGPMRIKVLTGSDDTGEIKADSNWMTDQRMKRFFPGNNAQRRSYRPHVEVGLRTDQSPAQRKSCSPGCATEQCKCPDHRSAEGISTLGQSRRFGSGTSPPCSTEELRRRGVELNSASLGILRERNGACNQDMAASGLPPALVRPFQDSRFLGISTDAARGNATLKSPDTVWIFNFGPFLCSGKKVSTSPIPRTPGLSSPAFVRDVSK